MLPTTATNAHKLTTVTHEYRIFCEILIVLLTLKKSTWYIITDRGLRAKIYFQRSLCLCTG